MATMSLQAAYDQARSYLEANKVEQAIGVAQHILEHFPENLEAHRILGEAYLAGRQFDQAEAAFGRVLHADPENIPAHVGMGITYERQGKLTEAVGEFEQALEVRPDMPELRSQLLRLYADVWGSEGATLRLSRPGLARLYAKGHMLPQAIQEFRSVIDEFPDRFDARVGLAEALWRDGQEDAAAEVCEEILAARPDVLKANLLLGYIRHNAGDDSGERFWRQAQQLEPYQGVARALFDTLPDLPAPDQTLPPWDEAAWGARRTEEEAAVRRTEEEAAVAPAAASAVTGAAAVSAADTAEDDFFGADWMREPDPNAEPPVLQRAEPAGGHDDFLASLLGFDEPGEDVSGSVDLDSSSSVTPFSFDELDPTAPPPPAPAGLGLAQSEAPAPAAGQEPDLFSFDDLGLSDDQSAHTEAASRQPAPGSLEEELAPFSLADLGLSDDEIAQLTGEPAPGASSTPPAGADADLAPLSLADLGLSDDEIAQLNAASTPAAPADEAGLSPFSLEELGLSDDEIAQLNAPGSTVDPATGPGLSPFSLEELGLSDDEIAQLNAASTPAAPDEELGLTPFSLEELGLSDDEIAQLEAGSTIDPATGPGLTPFSLEELGLSDDEIAQLEAGPSNTSSGTATGATAGMQPFDWGLDEESGSRASALPEGVDSDMPLDLEPFSLDDLDLNAGADDNDFGVGSLPPSLQPFSLDDASSPPPAPTAGPLPPIDIDEHSDTGGYSWQQPSAKQNTNFLNRGQQAEAGNSSIFAKLKQRASDLPKEEEPPLPPVTLSDDEAAAYFSPDDVSLREEDNTPERLTGSFRLPREEDTPAADVPPRPASASSARQPEPGLTPFSLAELGLSPDEIAALEQANAADNAAAGSSANAEPGLTPFSLAELGLSPDEIAALQGANTAGETTANTGETVVPGWSEDGDAGLTPFSFDEGDADPNAGIAEAETAGLEPFSFDEFDFEGVGTSGSSSPTQEIAGDVQPFSLDDLGLGDLDGPGGLDSSRELGLTDEELAGLDLGKLETIAAESAADDEPEIVTGDAALDKLINLGRRQGFVDLTDIISVVDDPEGEAERIEEIGWTLHRAGIQIRDGDEIIDMEAEEAEPAADELAASPEPTAAAYAGSDQDSDLTPFSLNDLGLSEEDIAALGLDVEDTGGSTPAPLADQSAPAGAASPARPTPSADAEPELTPFSLEELGLSPDEIAALEGAPGSSANAEPGLTPFSLEELGLSPDEIAALQSANADAPPVDTGGNDDDPFNFDLETAAPVERAVRTAPRVEEPPPPTNPADAGFTPEPLDKLDDIWDAATAATAAAGTAAAAAPTPGQPAAPSKPARTAEPARAVLPPRDSRSATPARGRDATPRASGRTPAPTRDDARYARREAARAPESRPSQTGSRGAPPARTPADFIPTGDEMLDDYLRQLEAEPDNYALALAVGRTCAQTGRGELAALAYKRPVRDGQLLDEIAEEIEGLVADSQGTVQRQLYRVLGDVYSKQGRLREAMAAYGQTFAR